ncbi:MAG: hypothetical protein ACRD4T_03035, partial [Candidatus Acidiferrales bacterium]
VELIQQDADTHPGKPVIFAAGFDELATLVRFGVRYDAQGVIDDVASIGNAPLQAHLLLDAAEGLNQAQPRREEQ